jgi:hypothetical protein
MEPRTKSTAEGVNRARRIRADARQTREVVALRRRMAQLDALLSALIADRLHQLGVVEMRQRPELMH